MAESTQQLKDQIRRKKQELDSVGNKLAGAGLGAAFIKNSAVGMALGAVLGREKELKKRLEKEISTLEGKIQDNERQVSRLNDKLSQLRNNFESDKARLKADSQQKRNDLERQKQSEQDTNRQRDISNQIARLQSDEVAAERDKNRAFEMESASVQREIHSLS